MLVLMQALCAAVYVLAAVLALLSVQAGQITATRILRGQAQHTLTAYGGLLWVYTLAE